MCSCRMWDASTVLRGARMMHCMCSSIAHVVPHALILSMGVSLADMVMLVGTVDVVFGSVDL